MSSTARGPSRAGSPAGAAGERALERSFHSLSAVTDRIAHYLEPALGRRFWVRAEISSGRERAGHFYCDLVETSPRGKVVAKIQATIWARDLIAIRRRFRDEGLELSIENGTLVGVLCCLQYSAQYGLSLQVEDADPAFALGELERKKREVLARLSEERLDEPNKRLRVPLLPQRIGLITSEGSAAYSDFVKTLFEARGFGFRIFLADASMQGTNTEGSILRALNLFDGADVDLVVIARGGGSKVDLYSLDNEILARAIARHRRPVWTGIGHQIDSSVLDFVANRAFVTPTAIAEELVARFVAVAQRLEEAQSQLPRAWAQRRETERDYVRRMTIGLRQGSRKLVEGTRTRGRLQAERLSGRVERRLEGARRHVGLARHKLVATPRLALDRVRDQLRERARRAASASQLRLGATAQLLARQSARFDRSRFERPVAFALAALRAWPGEASRRLARRLGSERREIDARQRTLGALDPKTILKRGFSLVYDERGALVSSVDAVTPGDSLAIRTRDGRIDTQVQQTEKLEDEQ